MSKRTAILFAVLVALSLSARLSAATRGTSAEAKAMLQKAIGHFKSAGRQQALADFTAGKPPFHDREGPDPSSWQGFSCQRAHRPLQDDLGASGLRRTGIRRDR